MRAVCDACEGAPARVFCAADEAALCPKCDEKVHGCNKLASRHIRLTLAEASAFRRCDICEIAPAFFFCAVDGTSLCLPCDMDVHVGSKRAHERYLLMGQRVELPISQGEAEGDIVLKQPIMELSLLHSEQQRFSKKQGTNFPLQEDYSAPAMAIAIDNTSPQMFDLNFRPQHEPSWSGNEMELANTDAEPSPDAQ